MNKIPTYNVKDIEIFYEDIGLDDPMLFLHSSYSRGLLALGGQIQSFSILIDAFFLIFADRQRINACSICETPSAPFRKPS
jgi:hypothetical protein